MLFDLKLNSMFAAALASAALAGLLRGDAYAGHEERGVGSTG